MAFFDDNGAAMAFYAATSLAPILLIVVAIAGCGGSRAVPDRDTIGSARFGGMDVSRGEASEEPGGRDRAAEASCWRYAMLERQAVR